MKCKILTFFITIVALSYAEALYEYGIREAKARRQSHVLVMSNSPKTRDPTSSKNIRWKKHDLLKKYTSQKEASRIDIGSDGLPAERLSASRPSKYKPVRSSGGGKGKRIMNQGSAREREIINPNRLRILGGTAKGKKIDSPEVYLRPMMGKVERLCTAR